jgi:hypothetical protein
MRTVLRVGSSLVKLIAPGETLRHFRDPQAAVEFLGRSISDPSDYVRIRQFLEQHSALDRTRTWSDAELLERFAALVLGGATQVVFGRTRPSEPGIVLFESPPEESAPEAPVEKTALSWLEIELVDIKGEPVANEPYKVVLADGTPKEGKLDALGRARFDDIVPGNCQVSFPEIDEIPPRTPA